MAVSILAITTIAAPSAGGHREASFAARGSGRRFLSSGTGGAERHDGRNAGPGAIACDRRADPRGGGASCRLSLLGTGGGLHLRGAQRAHVCARGCDCSFAFRGVRFHVCLRWRRLCNAAGHGSGGQSVCAGAGKLELDSIQLSERGHRATAEGSEHAIEVQLPWLEHTIGSFTLVPVVMGDQSYESSRALGCCTC